MNKLKLMKHSGGIGRNTLFLGSLLASTAMLMSACVCGPVDKAVYRADTSKSKKKKKRGTPPKSLANVEWQSGPVGNPRVVGCADGQREGFVDQEAHPRIAGCLGSWKGKKSLRAPAVTQACGDDKEDAVCDVPADVCAPGWHVCGTSGLRTDLTERTTVDDCLDSAGPGKFVAAMSHGQSRELCPEASTDTTEFPCWKRGLCSEAVCCGDLCEYGKCRDAVWPDQTKIAKGTREGCGGVSSKLNGGILCCYDGDANPAEDFAAGVGPATTAKAPEPKAKDEVVDKGEGEKPSDAEGKDGSEDKAKAVQKAATSKDAEKAEAEKADKK